MLAAAALAACSNDFEKQSQIVKLRVLGVRAEPAELIVGSGPPPSSTLTALAVLPDGGPTSVDFAICTDQTNPPAADLDCPGTQGIALPPAGPTSAVLDLSDPRIQQLAAALAQSANAGAALDQGVPIVIGFQANAADALVDGGPARQIVRGLTTISAYGPTRMLNHNPELAALRTDAGEVAADGGTVFAADTVQRLTPEPLPDAKEPTAEGPEKLGFSFFATAGEISSLRSTETTATGQPGSLFTDYTAPREEQQVRLWVVVRDGRGGTGWLERLVEVR
jgi:hypothetical protein